MAEGDAVQDDDYCWTDEWLDAVQQPPLAEGDTSRPDTTCVSVSGEQRQYWCVLDEGHEPPCEWLNVHPERGTEEGFYDYAD